LSGVNSERNENKRVQGVLNTKIRKKYFERHSFNLDKVVNCKPKKRTHISGRTTKIWRVSIL
jgi:hypothetical protein